MNENGGAKMSILAAAARLLSETTKPMRCKEIVDAAIERGLWARGTGKTPDRTLCAAFQRDGKKGNGSQFVKVARGQYCLRASRETPCRCDGEQILGTDNAQT